MQQPLESRADGHDSDVSALAGRVTVNEGDIDSLETKMGTGPFDTTELQTVVGAVNEVHGEVNAEQLLASTVTILTSLQTQLLSRQKPTRATNEEALIRAEFAATDVVVTNAYIAADAVVASNAATDATTKANTAEANAKTYADGIVANEAHRYVKLQMTY